MVVQSAPKVNTASPRPRISIMRATRLIYRWRSPGGARLSSGACALYLLWLTYVDADGQTPRWLTVARQAEDLGLSERQVQRAARELVAQGFATAVERRAQATVYVPHEIPDTRPARSVRGGDIADAPRVTSPTPGGVTSVTPNSDSDSQISNSISLPRSGPPHECAGTVEEVARRAGCSTAEARDRIELAWQDGRGARYGWSVAYLATWTRRGVALADARSSSLMPRRRAGSQGSGEQPTGRPRVFRSSDVPPKDPAAPARFDALRAALRGGADARS
jgi:hypothetical protein